jgi:lipopolysaccharide heptosyltransferase II
VSLIVRAPNHLGDLVLALPALALAGEADVQVVRFLAPLLRMARLRGEVLPLDRGARGTVRAAAALRRRGYRRGVLLPPSLGSAAIFALGGVGERRGTATDRRRALLTDAVDPAVLRGMHRVDAYCTLVSGRTPERTPAPRLVPDDAARGEWERVAGAPAGPVVGVFPGSNAPSRRWEAARFAAVARTLAGDGARVVVFGGPQERGLTAEVAGDWALDAGGRTGLAALSAGLARCALLVANDSGPQHVAAAVGTPVVALWGAGDPVVTRPVGEVHALLRRPDLPCVPCVKNVCPRAGRGYLLDDARNECIRLFTADEVVAAARLTLAARPT